MNNNADINIAITIRLLPSRSDWHCLNADLYMKVAVNLYNCYLLKIAISTKDCYLLKIANNIIVIY